MMSRNPELADVIARMSISAVAAKLSVSRKSVARWTRFGVAGVVLKTHRIGGRVYVLNHDLDSFVEATNSKPRGCSASGMYPTAKT